MSSKCVICNQLLNFDIVVVKERGIVRLIEASVERNDGKRVFFDGKVDIKLHRKCRMAYTNEKCIRAFLKRKGLQECSTDKDDFDFEQKCLFCVSDASTAFIEAQIKLPVHKRVTVSIITKEETKQSILRYGLIHDDAWSKEVFFRVKEVDLVKRKARYHYNCYSKFCHPKRAAGQKRGRPTGMENVTAMDHIYKFLEEGSEEDSQFSLSEIRAALCNIGLPSDAVIKYHLKQRYGDNIIISSGSPIVVCFLADSYKILQDSWYESRNKNESLEKLRIIETAAKMISRDIMSHPYENTYPAPAFFLDGAKNHCPESLMRFLDTLIVRNGIGQESLHRKSLAIGHAIISAMRPRSFVSPVLLGISALIHHKYASRYLIDKLNSVGFCASYRETLKFEMSAVATVNPDHNSEFTQYVFDNADVNVNTLDGHNTFHAMGGIACINSKEKKFDKDIPALKDVPKTFFKDIDNIPIKTFIKPVESGLKHVLFSFDKEEAKVEMTEHDLLWLYGKSQIQVDVPGWHRFMSLIYNNDDTQTETQVTKIEPLPFLNTPPSSYDTILSCLSYAANQCDQNKTEACVVTFDQPLYQKAQEIVKSTTDSLIKNITLRLGGFHMQMSFMGAIGNIMKGSGLKELWGTIYANGSLDKMLSGHHYERAVRAHMLSLVALFDLIYKKMDLNVDENIYLNCLIDAIIHENDYETEKNDEAMNRVIKKFEYAVSTMKENGPTAELWLSYVNMVNIMLNFIKSERTGNWHLHLKSVKAMVPYLHAAGHFNYAKSASLYLSDMENLKNVMPPDLYKKFIEGLFTVRRTSRPFSGTWTDMTIEQSLMRTMKTSGGVTQGRGLSDNVLQKWVLGLPISHCITESVERFCAGTDRVYNHKDGAKSRIERDASDIQILSDWLSEHDPFPKTNQIMSISTGVIGDNTINPHKALEVGLKTVNDKIGTPYSDLKYSRKETVQSLATVRESIKESEGKIAIEPDVIFKRICYTKRTQDELKQYLEYELAPYPLSLFDNQGMRKNQKSALYDMFEPVSFSVERNIAHVIDGGYLLHKVVWPKSATVEEIGKTYVEYIHSHFTNATVVFDGYDDALSIKQCERQRRSKGKVYPDIVFNKNTSITTSQENFLANTKNKQRIIKYLKNYLTSAGIAVYQSNDDADTMIIDTAVDVSSSETYDHVLVVGEDIDLLVILVYKKKTNITMMKPGKGKTPTKYYNASSLGNDTLSHLAPIIHALSGCDTTSATYKQGKKKVMNLVRKNKSLQEILGTFNEINVNPAEISKAGEQFYCNLYGGKASDNLNTVRYEKFGQLITKSSIDLASLPPTAMAMKQHVFRAYYQVQQWIGNKLDPREWGWTQDNSGLVPIQTTDKLVPDTILKIIACKCKKTCKGNCSCKKSGLKCTSLCIFCCDKICMGEPIIDEGDRDEDIEIELNRRAHDINDDDVVSNDGELLSNDYEMVPKLDQDLDSEEDLLNPPKRQRLST